MVLQFIAILHYRVANSFIIFFNINYIIYHNTYAYHPT